ncbi:unnamed protein product [Gadus morhua 'NCC']
MSKLRMEELCCLAAAGVVLRSTEKWLIYGVVKKKALNLTEGLEKWVTLLVFSVIAVIMDQQLLKTNVVQQYVQSLLDMIEEEEELKNRVETRLET